MMTTKHLIALAAALLILSTVPSHAIYAQPASTFTGGGGSALSANYANLGVIAQPGIVDVSSSTNYQAEHGFLPVLGGWRILYPVIAATPGTLSFTLVAGTSGDQQLAVANVGGSTLQWSVAKGNPAESWFTVSPTSGTGTGTGTGDTTITVTANAAGLAAGSYSDTLTVSGTGITQTVQVQLALEVTAADTYSLTVTVASDTPGKGGGAVNSSPAGIACTGGTCAADFSSGTTVTLMQTPDSNSTLATWSPQGCGTNPNCQVVMNGDQAVDATFAYAFMARVNSSGSRFDTLAQAYAGTAATDTILARDVTFTENLTLGGGKAITLGGGMSTSFMPQNAWTVLQGILTLQTGSLVVDRLVIK